MSYDSFKAQLTGVIRSIMPDDTKRIMDAVDLVAREYDIDLKDGESGQNAEEAMKIMEDFLAAKGVEEKSPNTLDMYRCVLRGFLSHVSKPVTAISPQDVREYLAYCKAEKHHKTVTIGNTRRVLSSFCEWCSQEGIIGANPIKRVAAIKAEPSPVHAMQRVELEVLRSSCTCVRDKALVDFLYSTGARVSEACNAKLSDINWEKKTLIIRHGKGNKTRTTYINPVCEVSLKAYINSRTDDSPYIFTRERVSKKLMDKPLSPKALQDSVNRIVRKSGHQYTVKVTPHVFRHTVATVALHNGMPVNQVQKFLGHEHIATTLIYAETDDSDVQRSHTMYTA